MVSYEWRSLYYGMLEEGRSGRTGFKFKSLHSSLPFLAPFGALTVKHLVILLRILNR